MPSMLNRVVLILFLPLLLVGCKARKSVPEGAPAGIKEKELFRKLDEAQGNFDNLRIKANATLTAEGTNQTFRLEVRIKRDSLIWVEVADPVLGLKLARVLITPDSIFMINRIDREYLKGDIGQLQTQFGVQYGFDELQRALSGDLVFDVNRGFDLYYFPGSYLLSSVNPTVLAEGLKEEVRDIVLQAYIDPSRFKATRQLQYDPVKQVTYSLVYLGFREAGNGKYYPDIIELGYGAKAENNLRLAVKRMDQNEHDLGFPFNIPSQYAEMR